MNYPLLNQIDKLISSFKENHHGEAPLYIVVSPDESKAVREELKQKENIKDGMIINTYRDIKIAEHPSLLDGKMYVSNELPETGS
jgi:hypothetical protein